MLEQLEQQKRLTANQWKLIATTNLADLLDFFDFFLIGYVLAFITKEWQLTYWRGAMILLSSGLGAVPGAFLWGWVADRIGRRKVFIAILHWMILSSTSCTPISASWTPMICCAWRGSGSAAMSAATPAVICGPH